MKKLSLLSLLLSTLLTFSTSCKKEKDQDNNTLFPCRVNESNCFKGRLEIKGICGLYTIKVLSGNIDTSLIETTWENEATGKTYENVFVIKNACSLPINMKEGDEFYFQILQTFDNNCFTCLAYSPSPKKALAIMTTNTPCIVSTN